MRVLYDHQTFTLQEYGGISRYFYELIKRGEADPGIQPDVALRLSNNAYLNSATQKGVFPFFPSKNFPGKYRTMNFINRSASITAIKKQQFDIFHPSYYDPYFLKYIRRKPFVLTFHDVIHEKFSAQFAELAQDKVIYNNKKILLEHAAGIIAVSNSTKKDITEIFGIDPNKITVIYLGSTFSAEQATAGRLHAAPYLLFVGSRHHYKNFSLLLQALPELSGKYPDLQVVCAGGGAFTEKETEAIKALNMSSKVFHYPINDNILANLYKNAEAFIFPSFYEGFGIPVLEAFACNCPLLLSNGGSLPEVAGGAALYFDPQEPQGLISATEKLLGNTGLRQTLLAEGEKRSQLFSWNNTYTGTISLYKTIQS